MDPFRRLAVFTIVRDASFVALAAATLMLAFSFNPPLALIIGANIALAFALILIFRSWRLTDERMRRTEAWRGLYRHERPAGESGRRVARALLDDLLLRTARAAAMAAIVLSSLSLLAAIGAPPPQLAVAESGAVVQSFITR